MKRIAGAVVLLTGLSGCITFTPPNGQPGAKSDTGVAQLAPPPSQVAVTQWLNSTQSGESKVATRASAPTLGPVNTQPAPPPAPMPALAASQFASQETAPPPPRPLPDMPVVVTPPRKVISQVNYVPSESAAETVEPATASVEAPLPAKPKPLAPLPVTPVVKNSMPAESKPAFTGKPGPLFRLVNTKRITLNFEVKDVGPSGLSGVELWYTQDAREWKKYDAPTKAHTYVVEVDEEGMYGFTLLARSGMGLGKEPPQAGDQPQVWVIVDLTRPDVELLEVTPSAAIRWRANDKNLGRRPISLSYAEKEEGPWHVIAAGLQNTGSYQWKVPKGIPSKILLRVEAVDLAGNLGRAQSSKPVVMDTARPVIVNVEATASN